MAMAAAIRAAPPAPPVVPAAAAAAGAARLEAAAGPAFSAVARRASAPAITAALMPTSSLRPVFRRCLTSRMAPVVARRNTGILPSQRFTGDAFQRNYRSKCQGMFQGRFPGIGSVPRGGRAAPPTGRYGRTARSCLLYTSDAADE